MSQNQTQVKQQAVTLREVAAEVVALREASVAPRRIIAYLQQQYDLQVTRRQVTDLIAELKRTYARRYPAEIIAENPVQADAAVAQAYEAYPELRTSADAQRLLSPYWQQIMLLRRRRFTPTNIAFYLRTEFGLKVKVEHVRRYLVRLEYEVGRGYRQFDPASAPPVDFAKLLASLQKSQIKGPRQRQWGSTGELEAVAPVVMALRDLALPRTDMLLYLEKVHHVTTDATTLEYLINNLRRRRHPLQDVPEISPKQLRELGIVYSPPPRLIYARVEDKALALLERKVAPRYIVSYLQDQGHNLGDVEQFLIYLRELRERMRRGRVAAKKKLSAEAAQQIIDEVRRRHAGGALREKTPALLPVLPQIMGMKQLGISHPVIAEFVERWYETPCDAFRLQVLFQMLWKREKQGHDTAVEPASFTALQTAELEAAEARHRLSTRRLHPFHDQLLAWAEAGKPMTQMAAELSAGQAKEIQPRAIRSYLDAIGDAVAAEAKLERLRRSAKG